jgi:hypothetical protein
MSDQRSAETIVARLRREILEQGRRDGEEDADERMGLAFDALREIERLKNWCDYYRAQWLGPLAVPPVKEPLE